LFLPPGAGNPSYTPLNLRGRKRNEKRWGGREGPVKSEAYMARKGLYAPDVKKSIKSEVRRAGITCKFSITRKRKKELVCAR